MEVESRRLAPDPLLRGGHGVAEGVFAALLATVVVGDLAVVDEAAQAGKLDLIERHHPGFRDLVEYSELGTPLTFEHFTAAPSGSIYGYPGTPDKYRKPWLAPGTPIRNLYLTGTDAGLLGIMGALMGGVLTASRLIGPLGFFQIMRAAASRSSPES